MPRENETLGLSRRTRAAADAIRGRWERAPKAGIVLGTGLHGLASLVAAEAVIPYVDIPGFPRSTALGHAGRLICGRLEETDVVMMDGRSHLYEGYTPADLSLPVYAMKALGIQLLVLSNASGGLNPAYASGDVVVIEDHIDLMFRTPPAGLGDSSPGDRHGFACDRGRQFEFAAATRATGGPYDPTLVERAVRIARTRDFVAHRGVYVGVTGPNYETRAEYRFLRKIGGDIVGMSTVPEAVAAAHCGLRTLALSTVTNVASPDRKHVTLAQDVVDAAQRAEPKLRGILLDVLNG
jgi:purine-nucleoside phosphorylase